MESTKQKIIRLRKEGLPYTRIAEEVPCAISTVWYYLTPGAKFNRIARSTEYSKSFMSELKARYGGSCSICKYDKCLQALDFHHLGQDEKHSNVSQLAAGGSFKKARIEAEKCVLLCCRCHREVHAGVTEMVIASGIAPVCLG